MFLSPCWINDYSQDILYRLDDFKCFYSTWYDILLELRKGGRKVNGWVM
jgi:hypothetical protein